MAVLSVRTGNLVVRCREESFGCFMFDSRSVCAEGNRTIFRFVRGLSEAKLPGAIAAEIAEETGAQPGRVYEDIMKFLKIANVIGWFGEVSEAEKSVAPP